MSLAALECCRSTDDSARLLSVHRGCQSQGLMGVVQDPLVKLGHPENRGYCINKCSPDCMFNFTEYGGEYVPYCVAGPGYAMSWRAVTVCAEFWETEPDLQEEVYDDLVIGKVLALQGIYPSIGHTGEPNRFMIPEKLFIAREDGVKLYENDFDEPSSGDDDCQVGRFDSDESSGEERPGDDVD